MSKQTFFKEEINKLLNKSISNDDLIIITDACSYLKLKMSDPLEESLFDEMELCGKIKGSIWFDVTQDSKDLWKASIQHSGGDVETITSGHKSKEIALLNGLLVLLSKDFI